MSRIYVFTASKFEAEPALKLGASNCAGKNRLRGGTFAVGPNELTLIIGGMGPRNAKTSAHEALRPWVGGNVSSATNSLAKPDFVLVIGLCGGLIPSIGESQVVSYSNCLSNGAPPELALCSESISRGLVELLNPRGIACQLVLGMTTQRIATRKNERATLACSGASVVDMESYEILAVSAAARVPAAVLRVVGDCFERELPDFNRALGTQGTLDGRKTMWIALGSPVRTVGLLAANKRAINQLARALAVVLAADWSTR